MRILLKEINKPGFSYKDTYLLDKIEMNGDEIFFNGPISFDGILDKTEEYVDVKGKAFGKLTTNCGRCGKGVEKEFEIQIDETYKRNATEEEYNLIGDEINFDQMLKDNIRLNLPVKFLCNENCKGVCPSCGKNLNDGNCDCEKEEKTSPFDVLKNMLK